MNKLIPFLIVLCSYSVFAQESQEINANNIRTILQSNGLMFFDGNSAQFQVPFVDSDSPSAIFAGGIWLGGIGPQGIKVSSSTYSQGIYVSGLYNEVVNFDFDRVWKVTGQEINAHIQDASDGTIDNLIPESITSWPAAGNEGLENIDQERLASFVDVDGDNLYDPTQGDYPAVIVDGEAIIPDELLLTIIHAQEQSFFDTPKMEVHQIFYAFNGEGNELLSNSLFTQQKVISREDEPLTDFRFSYWLDIDIGCLDDDYFGSDVARNSIFGYNADSTDGQCTFDTPMYEDPPTLSLTFLNNELTYSTYSLNPFINSPPPGTADPNFYEEDYLVMGGNWRDGTPMTVGGLGYNPDSTNLAPVRHALSGDPTIPGEWSMVNENLPGYDIRGLATHEISTFSPGDILVMDAVINFTNCPGYLEDIPKMKENIDLLQEIYDTGFSGVTSIADVNQVELSLFPNPSSGQFIIESSLRIESFEVLSLLGESITKELPLINNEIDLNLSSGTYLLRVTAADGSISTHRFIIQ